MSWYNLSNVILVDIENRESSLIIIITVFDKENSCVWKRGLTLKRIVGYVAWTPLRNAMWVVWQKKLAMWSHGILGGGLVAGVSLASAGAGCCEDTMEPSKSPLHQSGLNTLRPRKDGCQFPDDIFRCTFLNENEWYRIKISLKFVPKVPINNIPALVQIMAWHRPGDKPLSEPMMVVLPTHICVTRPQWVNPLAPGRSGRDFKNAILNLVSLISIFRSSYDDTIEFEGTKQTINK